VLADTQAVVMRKDPPFDSEYFYATHLLGQAEREGASLQQAGGAARPPGEAGHPGVSAVHHADAGDAQRGRRVRAFHDEHRDIILKPLDGMGGMGIFRVGPDGLNLGSIIETLNRRRAHADGAALPARDRARRQARARHRRPARALLPGAHPAGQRDPRQPGRRRQGRGAAAERRRPRIAEALGPVLAARGLLLVGLDVIGDSLTEINVTSPTCFQEITADRLRRRRDVHRRAGGGGRMTTGTSPEDALARHAADRRPPLRTRIRPRPVQPPPDGAAGAAAPGRRCGAAAGLGRRLRGPPAARAAPEALAHRRRLDRPPGRSVGLAVYRTCSRSGSRTKARPRRWSRCCPR
jgi:hypothetical protein